MHQYYQLDLWYIIICGMFLLNSLYLSESVLSIKTE